MLQETLDKMILTTSGWRAVFAPDGEEGTGECPDLPHRLLAVGIGLVWGQFLIDMAGDSPTVLVAMDTRPTGSILAEMIMRGLEYAPCEVRYASVVAAPEVMARSGKDSNITGFLYVSASHNPVGYNGVKFGIANGVIGGNDARKLIENYRVLIESDDAYEHLSKIAGNLHQEIKVREPEAEEKQQCLHLYRTFLEEVAGGLGSVAKQSETLRVLREALKTQHISIVADLNGSARCESVDREYCESLGLKFYAMNALAGQIAHTIEPEGEALTPCCRFLEDIHKDDPSALLGYVPDNDGDRGNLVIWDENIQKARSLEAQEVFALSALAELSFSAWSADTEVQHMRQAVVVNGPTSHRIREIAAFYGAEVYETEVGEANVVLRARELRKEGMQVRFLGEGSNGGTIIHPSAVRDPLNTVTALLKLLYLPSVDNHPAPLQDWFQRIGKPGAYHDRISLSSVVDTLPKFFTTPASARRAKIKLSTQNHAILKESWERIFQRQFLLEKETLQRKYGFAKWVEFNNEGIRSRCGIGAEYRSGEHRGGLKIVFYKEDGAYAGFLWMRGSGTEPVFRIMAEVKELGELAEQELLKWFHSLIIEADNECSRET